MRSEQYERGLEVRREVVGEKYVAKALASADEFTSDLQDFITEACWGQVWTRPGLNRKARSMITMAILVATSKYTELGVHVRGALKNGCTPDEIKEVLLHCFVYCGVPSALESFRAAQPVVGEWQREARTSPAGPEDRL